MGLHNPLWFLAIAALSACTSASETDLSLRSGPQAFSPSGMTTGGIIAPVAAASQPLSVAVPTSVPNAPQPVASSPGGGLVVVPNQTGPAVPGQITQAETELLASAGVPATQENIDFIRLALQ